MEIRTKEIMEEFNLSRQTLYNWIKEGTISKPKKDWRGWRMWTEQHVEEIKKTIRFKEEQLSLPNLNDKKLQINNRRYLGSKYKLLDFIRKIVVENCQGIETVADIFGGTGVVADLFNREGKNIIVNDILYSNYMSYWTWFRNDPINEDKISSIIHELNHAEPEEDNYVSKNFGGTYFTQYNAKKIGYIREQIELLSESLTFREKAILITSLLYAMDKVANTVGHYDAYRRKLDSFNKLTLLVPDLNDEWNEGNQIYKEDANELVKQIRADLFYIDTPYNSRQYGDAYHLLENISEWKKPEVMGVARKMVNRSHIKSDYCTMKAPQVFADLVSHIDGKYILVSYNNMAKKGVGRSNAKISAEEIIGILETRGPVQIFETEFHPFTTGKSMIEDHKEILYLCEIRR
ncbi:DNA adenine methylase [Caldifermentibacillus hisashii]|uniref:DNA adenine methylase n=1 Tax=Caldifermentibacillus hisashii TaxID=996558 RepID=UPI0031FD3B2B